MGQIRCPGDQCIEPHSSRYMMQVHQFLARASPAASASPQIPPRRRDLAGRADEGRVGDRAGVGTTRVCGGLLDGTSKGLGVADGRDALRCPKKQGYRFPTGTR